jgi:hypothetical protein
VSHVTRRFGIAPRDSRRRLRSFLTLEVIASIGLTTALAIMMLVAVLQYAAARRENDTRQLLRLTIGDELAHMRAGLSPVADFDRTLPTSQPAPVHLVATTSPGAGLWHGLTMVRIVASQNLSDKRKIEVELAAYVAPGGAAP